MNILYHFRTRGSGAEAVHISGIATAFEQLGHSVVFSSPRNVDPRKGAGSNPFGGGSKGGLIWRALRACPDLLFEILEVGYNIFAFAKNSRLLRDRTFDLIYERHAFFLCATALLAKARRIPYVVEVNELVGDERLRKQPTLAAVARFSDRLVFKAASLVVVVSPHLKRRIEAMGIDPAKVCVLPNAVNEDQLVERDGKAVRVRFNLDGACVIGFVGWFVEWHRLDLLVEAIAHLAKDGHNVRLMLVGDGPLRTDLEEQARNAGCLDKISFAGPVPHSQVAEYIAAMDIPVVPHSNDYRSPIKLFEYMAQGKPVVAAATEPIRDVLIPGDSGLLFTPGSYSELVQALATLACDPEVRVRLGRRARQEVEEKHTWLQNARVTLLGLRGPCDTEHAAK